LSLVANIEPVRFISSPSLLPSLSPFFPSPTHRKAGEYFFIQFPGLSQWEWHPYSVAYSEEEEAEGGGDDEGEGGEVATFFVKDCGRFWGDQREGGREGGKGGRGGKV